MSTIAQAQQYVFRVYRQPEGLKNLAVNALARDPEGFLWLATENGVYRFLGSRFERFGVEQGIQEANARDLITDPQGNLWVATDENLYRWDGERFQLAWTKKIAIAGSRRMAIEDESHLLIVSNGQLYRLEHRQGQGISFAPVFSPRLLQAMPELRAVLRVGVVSSGGTATVWVSSGESLYSFAAAGLQNPEHLTPQSITRWDQKNGLPAERWESVLLDRFGTLWAAGQNHIAVLPRGTTRFVDRSIPGSDPENAYGHSPLAEDEGGRVLAVSDDGLARWDGHGWQTINRGNGLFQSSRISGMVFDASGDLWLSSMGGGLYSWVGYRNWQGWSDNQGLQALAVWSLLPSGDGRMLIGTDHGLAWADPQSGALTPLNAAAHWKLGQISALERDDQGVIWGGTFVGGVLHIDPKTGAVTKTATLPSLIYQAVKIPGEGIFYSTRHGLWGGKDSGHPQRIAAVDALLGADDNVVAGCAGREGDGWFLSNNRLLHDLHGKWSLTPITGMNHGRGKLIALSCAADGSLWAAGQQTGIWRLHLQDGALHAFELVVPGELRGLAPLSIFADQRGWIWVGSDQGLLVWNGHDWRHLTQESGLIWNDIDQGVMMAGRDGSLWVGTSAGVAHLMHPEEIFAPEPMKIALTGMRRGGKLIPQQTRITLPWSSLPLVIQVASSNFRNRTELVYRYQMEGLQTGWSDDADGELSFSALPPGDYTLSVYAYNAGLNTASQQLSLHITILAPWWRSYWLMALGIAALVALIYLFNYYRERQLRVRSRELEQLVSERTRELEFSREQLRVQATHDGLTGMLNRRGILRAVSNEMERARREKRSLVLALVDLDYFKRINDTYGHLAGDEALRWFASAMGAAVRTYDHAGRYGGEEFLVALTQVPGDLAMQRLEALHAAISNLQVRTRESEFKMTCTIGATVVDEASGYIALEAALSLADQALYDAKAAGRNRVMVRSAAPGAPAA
jgi:diguanylate cyclase (GGDEF)-like protein